MYQFSIVDELCFQSQADKHETDIYMKLKFKIWETKKRKSLAYNCIMNIILHGIGKFILSKYIELGVEELEQEKLPQLLEIKTIP